MEDQTSLEGNIQRLSAQVQSQERQIRELQDQLVTERNRLDHLAHKQADFERGRAYQLVQWLWKTRLALIPDNTWLARRLGFGVKSSDLASIPATLPSIAASAGAPVIQTADTHLAAQALNQQLYSDALNLPKDDVDQLASEFTRILQDVYHAGPADIEAWKPHWRRFALTIKALEKIIPADAPVNVLEMGEENPVTQLLRVRFPAARWHNTRGDLRQPWDYPSDSMDILISTEVLEHLQDLPDGIQELFTRSGLKAALREAHRVVKPGGRFFGSTPNGVSIYHLRNLLLGYEAWCCSPHIREYSVAELLSQLKEAGFVVEHWSTVHCMSVHYGIDYTPIYQILLEHQFTANDRGDDLFFVARK